MTDIWDFVALGCPQGETPLQFGQHQCGLALTSHLVGLPAVGHLSLRRKIGGELLIFGKGQGSRKVLENKNDKRVFMSVS